MKTFFVYDKGTSISQIASPEFMPAGIPQSVSPVSPSLQRQTSSHGSLAAVVIGIIQATKHNSMNTTRKCFSLSISLSLCDVQSYNNNLARTHRNQDCNYTKCRLTMMLHNKMLLSVIMLQIIMTIAMSVHRLFMQ